MKVFILGNEFDVYPSQDILVELEGIVRDCTIGTNYSFSHMIIDGHDVYDHRAHIMDNMSDIKQIEIVVETEKGLIKSTLFSVKGDIDNIISMSKQLSEDFSKNTDRNAFMDMIPLFGNINLVFTAFNNIETDENLNDKISNYEAWNEYAKEVYSLSETIKSLQGVMAENDVLAISKSLVSDLIPVLENMKEKISNLL